MIIDKYQRIIDTTTVFNRAGRPMKHPYDPRVGLERPRERTDTLFFWAIGAVVLLGIGGNIYSSYSAEAPNMDRLLDLLAAPRTKICDQTGAVISQATAFKDANCADRDQYRIVVGSVVVIFEQDDSTRNGSKEYIRIGEIDHTAMNRLFNLKDPARQAD